MSIMADIFQPSHFFNPEISDGEIISQLGGVFQQELDRLQRAYSIRDPSIEQPSKTPSPSRVLYGVEYDEVNRTLVSVLALRWLRNDDYDVFTAGQPKGALLTRESFRWLQQRALDANVYGDADSLAALVTALVINDLGKDPQLAIDYREATGHDIASLNHDAVLLRACEAGMVAALKRLPDPQLRAEVVRGLELGADFNYGQLAQAESAPACLAHLRGFRSPADRHAVALHFVEQLLDIAGAAGHMDWTSARKLIEPIAKAYAVCHEVVQDILSRDGDGGDKDGDAESLGASYNVVLARRAEMLRDRGFARVARPRRRAPRRPRSHASALHGRRGRRADGHLVRGRVGVGRVAPPSRHAPPVRPLSQRLRHSRRACRAANVHAGAADAGRQCFPGRGPEEAGAVRGAAVPRPRLDHAAGYRGWWRWPPESHGGGAQRAARGQGGGPKPGVSRKPRHLGRRCSAEGHSHHVFGVTEFLIVT